jgi:G3E family GTPase
VRGRIVPAGVVAVIDAEAGAVQLAQRDEARAQVMAADRVLLRKLDRASAGQLADVRARLAELNAKAELASFPDSDDGAMAMTGWLLEARRVTASGHGHGHAHGPATGGRGHHHKHSQLNAAVFVDDAPLLADAVLDVVRALGPRLVRLKGFVRISDSPAAAFLELAGTALTLRRDLPWPGDAPRTELVFIGDDLDEPAIRRALWACRVAGG